MVLDLQKVAASKPSSRACIAAARLAQRNAKSSGSGNAPAEVRRFESARSEVDRTEEETLSLLRSQALPCCRQGDVGENSIAGGTVLRSGTRLHLSPFPVEPPPLAASPAVILAPLTSLHLFRFCRLRRRRECDVGTLTSVFTPSIRPGAAATEPRRGGLTVASWSNRSSRSKAWHWAAHCRCMRFCTTLAGIFSVFSAPRFACCCCSCCLRIFCSFFRSCAIASRSMDSAARSFRRPSSCAASASRRPLSAA